MQACFARILQQSNHTNLRSWLANRPSRSCVILCSRWSQIRKIHNQVSKSGDDVIHSQNARENAVETRRAEDETAGQAFNVLKERGMINQITGEVSHLETVFRSDRRPGAYIGIDPTASSIHVGHMVPLMALFWMVFHGHEGVMLVGGATGQIGDPTGRLVTRNRLFGEQRKANVTAITGQLQAIWSNAQHLAREHAPETTKSQPKNAMRLRNNLEWMKDLNLLDFLSVIGHNLRIGMMLSRDSVKLKMEKGDGMSFAEFTYPALQAWDWWHLYSRQDKSSEGRIQIQIGGSDQYGNIVTGMDVVKSILKAEKGEIEVDNLLDLPIGFTVPLLTAASGEKFGKSAGNALWLDAQQTRVFDLYGYFVKTADADVERLLKLFTFVSLPKIAEVMDRHKSAPEHREAQHLLAYEFVRLAHGDDFANAVAESHSAAFSKAKGSFRWKPSDADFTMPRQQVVGKLVKVLLADLGAGSKAQASRLLKNGGVYLAESGASGHLTWRKLMGSAGASFEDQSDSTVQSRWIWPSGMLVFRLGKSKVVSVHVVEKADELTT